MLARLGACRWFPELYSVIGGCTGGVPDALGRVSFVRMLRPALLLQSLVFWFTLFRTEWYGFSPICVNLLCPGRGLCDVVKEEEILYVPSVRVVFCTSMNLFF